MACRTPVVTVKQGQLRGVIEENVYGGEFHAYRGIPYAKPPVGPLRFKDPLPPEPWTGIKDVSKFSDVCSQFDILTNAYLGSEDCLYLNVYTPSRKSDSKRAVMVWIHGGAFSQGSGDSTIYGPDYLLRKDVVLVTFNYRLGILGFLNLEHEVATGNQGLKDQVMALRWVQENISNFGGDPDNVTLFGESAGGCSVHYHTISPMSRGLFHKAIAQSGSAANPWALMSREPKSIARRLVDYLGETSHDPETMVEFLRSMDMKKLLFAQDKLVKPEQKYILSGQFVPTIDDKSPNPFLPQHPSILMQTNVNMPVLLGHNGNEGSMLVSMFLMSDTKRVIQKMNENFGLIIHPELQDLLKREGVSIMDLKRIYFGNQLVSQKTLQNFSNCMSDTIFIRGIHDTIKVLAEKNSQPTYFYKFTYDDPASLTKLKMNIVLPGATHAEELVFLFFPYAIKALNISPPELGTEKFRIIEYFTQMWTDFAKTGNPTPKTTGLISTIWKPVEHNKACNYLEINKRLQMKTLRPEECTFDWKGMKNKL